MKANFENLIKVMEVCAKAHNAEFEDWSDEGQLGIHAENIPTLSDVQTIYKAFFVGEYVDVEMEYGYVNMWLSDQFRDEVDEMLLQFALPCGALDELKKTCA